jgi:hypothetical protein
MASRLLLLLRKPIFQLRERFVSVGDLVLLRYGSAFGAAQRRGELGSVGLTFSSLSISA